MGSGCYANIGIKKAAIFGGSFLERYGVPY
jgi:hypothetical protein